MVAAAALLAHLAHVQADPGAASTAASPRAAWDAAQRSAVVADASSLGVVAIQGPDAATFLQGQLSNDVQALAAGHGQRTTYNSPKGRMLATMFVVRTSADRYEALVARDLVAPIRKRLAMFVLRAKVAIDAPEVAILGVAGPAAAEAIRQAFGIVPSPSQLAEAGAARVVHLPDGRFVVLAAESAADEAFAALASHATAAGADVWAWLDVASGVPVIDTATQDRFVAQTANQDVLGALSFRKGCYTGQEIVARTQHLGRLKERLYLFATEVDAPAPSTPLYGEPFGDQACGSVVNSARDPDGGSRFLAVVQIAAADAGLLAIGATDGPRAHRLPLPYEVPPPAAPRARVKL